MLANPDACQLHDIARGLKYRMLSLSRPRFSDVHAGSVHSKSVVHGDLTGVRTVTHRRHTPPYSLPDSIVECLGLPQRSGMSC